MTQPPRYSELSDAALLAASAEDSAAFGEFYDRHVEAILAFCYRQTACTQTAHDLAAETFAGAFANRGKYRDTGAPARAWLYGIARRQIGSFARRRRVSNKYRNRLGMDRVLVHDDEMERVERQVDLAAMRGSLRDAMADLPEQSARAVRLRVVDELPYAEVARQLGCSVGAARVRVCRALGLLADSLDEAGI